MTTITLLIITVLLWGSAPILEKIGVGKTDPLTAVTIRSFAITTALLISLTLSGKIKDVFATDIKAVIIFSVSGLMAGLLGMWAYLSALRLGETSKVVPIAATYPLVTALLSVLILKEGVTVPRIIGTVLIVTGVWFVK